MTEPLQYNRASNMTPLQQNVTGYLYEVGGETAVDVFMWATDQPWCDRHAYIAERLALTMAFTGQFVEVAADIFEKQMGQTVSNDVRADLKRFISRRVPEASKSLALSPPPPERTTP